MEVEMLVVGYFSPNSTKRFFAEISRVAVDKNIVVYRNPKRGIILIGDIGGTAEEDVAALIKLPLGDAWAMLEEFILKEHLSKSTPVTRIGQGHETISFKSNFASWSATFVPEETIGNVATIVSGGKGTTQDKIRTLREAGVIVVESPSKIGVAMLEMETEGHEVVETPFLEILAAGGKMSIIMSRSHFR
ncbi:unnamed protein product [Lactuca saligna]|uniref:Uncharacterized protein n=1 Tax=Lactuca saligna TaxID=75948 RepID=A0AA35USS3_LACSI|nr:unnamed protein product [Lactuca saligna]